MILDSAFMKRTESMECMNLSVSFEKFAFKLRRVTSFMQVFHKCVPSKRYSARLQYKYGQTRKVTAVYQSKT